MKNRSFLGETLLVLWLLFAPAQRSDATLQIWRTQLDPTRPDAAWCFVFDAQKNSIPYQAKFTLVGSKTTVEMSPFQPASVADMLDGQYATGLIAPAGTPRGEYQLKVNDQPLGTIQIVVSTPSTPTYLSPIGQGQDDSSAINAALAKNPNVVLNPGLWTITGPIGIPDGGSVRGSHRDLTILRYRHNAENVAKGAREVFFRPAAVCQVSDLTCESDPLYPASPASMLDGNQHQGESILSRLKSVNTTGVGIDFGAAGLLVDDVIFVGCCPFTTWDGQLWRNITYEGLGPDPTVRGTSVVCLDWRCIGTRRGIVFRQGPRNSWLQHLTFENIVPTGNAGEILLVEDAVRNGVPPVGLQSCRFSEIVVRNCAGPTISLFATPASNNIFYTITSDSGAGIWLLPDGTVQSNNRFMNIQLRGGVVYFGEGATGNILEETALIDPRPSWGGVTGWNAQWYQDSAAIFGLNNSVGYPVNKAKNITVRGLLPNWSSGLPGGVWNY